MSDLLDQLLFVAFFLAALGVIVYSVLLVSEVMLSILI